MTVLRQIEVAVRSGKPTPQACREADITEQTYYQWHKDYGGLKLGLAKRLSSSGQSRGGLATYTCMCQSGFEL